ncbi:MAG: hypothetical protein QMD00_04630 [Hadesarchaea archaeon]|nr:hypothetical protein [Hadesarchaea archaeon]
MPVHIWGAFACLLHNASDEDTTPAALWVIANGRFTQAACTLARALNNRFGRELFVLIDGLELERLMPEGARSPLAKVK